MSVVGDHYCPTEGHGVTAPGEPEPRLGGIDILHGRPPQAGAGRRNRLPWKTSGGVPGSAEPVDLEQRDGMVTRG
jgi:hypothetical protein